MRSCCALPNARSRIEIFSRNAHTISLILPIKNARPIFPKFFANKPWICKFHFLTKKKIKTLFNKNNITKFVKCCAFGE